MKQPCAFEATHISIKNKTRLEITHLKVNWNRGTPGKKCLNCSRLNSLTNKATLAFSQWESKQWFQTISFNLQAGLLGDGVFPPFFWTIESSLFCRFWKVPFCRVYYTSFRIGCSHKYKDYIFKFMFCIDFARLKIIQSLEPNKVHILSSVVVWMPQIARFWNSTT